MHALSTAGILTIARTLSVWAGIGMAFQPSAGAAEQAGTGIPVDVELVIAVDVSHSMDFQERHLQRDGFALAYRNPEILAAIRSGPHQRIAVTVMEWAGDDRQTIILPWTLIRDEDSALAVSQRLAQRIPGRQARGTAIGSAMLKAASLFGKGGYAGSRRVIDVSGDGASNRGPEPAKVRDALVALGITINGLPIVYRDPFAGPPITAEATAPPLGLAEYYQANVIGGPGAFVEPVRTIDQFGPAIRRKLLREIRGPLDIADQRDAGFSRQAAAAPSRPAETDDAIRVAATTWPIAARSRADGPPR
jgi:hypothetical protein